MQPGHDVSSADPRREEALSDEDTGAIPIGGRALPRNALRSNGIAEPTGGLLRRWSSRLVERERPDAELARLFEHLASLEVQIGSLEDRLQGDLAERDAQLSVLLRSDLARVESALAESVCLAIADQGRRQRRALAWVTFLWVASIAGLVAFLLQP